ncbi:MAG: hypothetical protein WDO13_08355 [Verrucomicrobiota bacterium]
MQTRESVAANPELLRDIDILFTGWGAPRLDRAFLDAAPKLEAVFHASGSVKQFITDDLWTRDIRVSTANGVFIIPVAEFTVSQILFCLKNGWQSVRATRQQRTFVPVAPFPGAYGTTVGWSRSAPRPRYVRELLRAFAVKVIAPCGGRSWCRRA